MANGIEVAKAYVTIVPTMEGSQATISKELGAVTEPAAKEAGESSGKTFGESLASGLKTTGAVIAGAMAAATGAAVALGKGFIDAANDVATLGDTIDKESQKMNMSATGYQEWDFILQHAGTSIEGMKTSMKKLTLAAEENNDAFAALGISEEQLASMSPEETWNATISALQGVTDESERLELANSLLGKGAVELAPLFNMTAEETEALKQQVHDLGGVMSDEAVKDAAAYQDSLQNMNTALDGLKKNMMSNFLPSITTVMDGLAKVFSGDGSGIGQIKSGLQSVITNITQLAPQFLGLAQTIITSLLSGFAPMLPQIVETVFGVLIQAVTIVTGMLPDMLPIIISGIEGIMNALFEALPVIVEGLGQFITSIVTWLSEGDNVTKFVNGLIELASQIVNQIAVLLPVLLPAIVRIITEIAMALTDAKNVKLILDAVLVVVGAVVVALAEALPEIVKQVVLVTDNILQTIASFFGLNREKVAQALANIIQTVTNWGNNVKNFITNLINNIKNNFTNWLNNLKNGFTNAFNFIRDKVQTITNKVKDLVNNVINTIKELPNKVVSIGRNLVEGLWNGISDKIQWVKNKIYAMGDQILSAIKSVFGIASPSKEFAKVGSFLAEGLGIGFDDEMVDVRKDMVGSMSNLTGNMTATVSAYGVGADQMGNNTTLNGGAITVNVYAAQGQSETDIANRVALKLEEMTRRKGAIYA